MTYTATIPGSLITAGSMIRWRVQVGNCKSTAGGWGVSEQQPFTLSLENFERHS